MARDELVDFDRMDLPEDRPLVFAGRPGAMRGMLPLINTGERKVVLRHARLRSAPIVKAAAALQAQQVKDEEAAAPIPQTISTLVLQPGQRQRVPVDFAIGPHTPPGEYEGEVEIGGHVRRAVFHVTEQSTLEVSPEQLVIENIPGQKVRKRVVFSNQGNIPLTIGSISPVALEQEYITCFASRAAIAAGDDFETLDRYYVEFLKQTGRIVEQTGVLRVRNTAKSLVIQPGEVKPVDLEFRIPDRLEKRSRYFGTIPFYTADLELIIVPAASQVSDEDGEDSDNDADGGGDDITGPPARPPRSRGRKQG